MKLYVICSNIEGVLSYVYLFYSVVVLVHCSIRAVVTVAADK